MDAHLVGGLADFLYQRGEVLRRSGWGGIYGLHGTGFFAHGAPFSGRGTAPSGQKSVVLTVNNVLRRLFGGSGVFLPEVFPVKEDWRAPFQDTGIDTGMG